MTDSSASDSSSSGTDSDMEDVEDEEVAKLNASLIGNVSWLMLFPQQYKCPEDKKRNVPGLAKFL